MTIGRYLKERRKAAGKTQTDIVVATRISQSQLSDYEQDRVVPSATRLVQMLRALDVDTLDLTLLEDGIEDSEATKGLYLDMAA